MRYSVVLTREYKKSVSGQSIEAEFASPAPGVEFSDTFQCFFTASVQDSDFLFGGRRLI
jgi:hypothetical protein